MSQPPVIIATCNQCGKQGNPPSCRFAHVSPPQSEAEGTAERIAQLESALAASREDVQRLSEWLLDFPSLVDGLHAAALELLEVSRERDEARGLAAAYRRDFDAELAGNAAMRERLGAQPHETMFAFVDRLWADRIECALREPSGPPQHALTPTRRPEETPVSPAQAAYRSRLLARSAAKQAACPHGVAPHTWRCASCLIDAATELHIDGTAENLIRSGRAEG